MKEKAYPLQQGEFSKLDGINFLEYIPKTGVFSYSDIAEKALTDAEIAFSSRDIVLGAQYHIQRHLRERDEELVYSHDGHYKVAKKKPELHKSIQTREKPAIGKIDKAIGEEYKLSQNFSYLDIIPVEEARKQAEAVLDRFNSTRNRVMNRK